MSNKVMFNSSVLKSADDLENHISSSKKTFPRGWGEKLFLPSGTWLEEKQLDCVLRERFDMMKEERIVKRSDLSYGEWHPEIQFVIVTKGKGKALQRMGFHQNGKHLLYPVEALFLMESSLLQVTYNGFPISIEEGYVLLLNDGLEKYQVYSHLSRLGYTVVMHQKCERFTPYEKKIRLDQHINALKHPCVNLLANKDIVCKDLVPSTEEELVKNSQLSLPKNSCDADDSSSTSLFPSWNICNMHSSLGTMNSNSLFESEFRKNALESKRSNNLPTFTFPIYLPNKDIEMKSPPLHLLPKNVLPSKSIYTLRPHKVQHIDPLRQPRCGQWSNKVSNQQKNEHKFYRNKSSRTLSSLQKFPSDRSRSSSWHHNRCHGRSRSTVFPSTKRKKEAEVSMGLEEYPCAIPKLKFHVANWKEFKLACTSTDTSWPLFDEFQPLVTTTVSTDELHTKIKVVSEANFDTLADRFCKTDSFFQCCSKIDFDVYLPHVYKKHNPSSPSLRLSVISMQEPVPSLAEVAALHIDDVPLYFAVVDHGEINFCGFQAVKLCSVQPMVSIAGD